MQEISGGSSAAASLVEPPLSGVSLADLVPAELLAAAEANRRARLQAQVDEMLIALGWCDAHAHDPQQGPEAVPAGRGGDRLVELGGPGSPAVAELCLGELAIAMGRGHLSTRNLVADALDLRHRFPRLWAEVVGLRLPAWLAGKVAGQARKLSAAAAATVDAALVVAVDESAHRFASIAEAKIIEADLEAHRARVAADAQRTGCWLSRPRVGEVADPSLGEPATRRISAKLPAGDAVEFDAVIEDLADALAANLDPSDAESEAGPLTRGQLRARAFALLASPHQAAAFLDGLAQPPSPEPPASASGSGGRRRRAVVHVHLSALALAGIKTGVPGLARVEGLGPFLLDQLAELLGRRDITLQPVLDLAAMSSVNAYEHPTVVRERAIQRLIGDAFPHSTNLAGLTGRLDLDHPRPYRPPGQPSQPGQNGPPGQTGDHNAAPLTRTHHRIKTHARRPDGTGGYQVDQLGLGAYRWITPHGIGRVVTPRGTTPITLARARDGTTQGEIYPGPPGLTIELDLPPDTG